MRKLLNTLFVTIDDAFLTEENGTVVIRQKEKKLGQIPLRAIEGIVMFTYPGASPALLGKCADMGIGVSMLTPRGKFLCRTVGGSRGNVLLRKEQYRISDDEKKALPYIRNMILGKVYNQRWNIGRILRDHPLRVNQTKMTATIDGLKDKIKNISEVESVSILRGMEGESAADYFSVFDDMILNQKEDFFFHRRSRRPPLDNVNAMLSFCYTLLANDCANALESVGLDSYVGFMHTDKPGRKSMALDLMEELRAPFADRFVLTLINKKQVQPKDFVKMENGAVRFDDEARKRLLSAWQERKQKQIMHPYLQEKIEWGLVPYAQALLIARCIRGDLEEYPPFLWK